LGDAAVTPPPCAALSDWHDLTKLDRSSKSESTRMAILI
jgi:hypothetical protein